MFHSAAVPSPDSPQPDPQAGRYTDVPRTSPPSARKTRGLAGCDVPPAATGLAVAAAALPVLAG
jgi:hypothetical protein